MNITATALTAGPVPLGRIGIGGRVNSTEKELWDGVRGLGVLGVLRLLWLGCPKIWAAWQARVKQGVDVRRVTVEESRQKVEEIKQKADEGKTSGDHALSLIERMEARIGHQDERQDAQEVKTARLQEQVEVETEQRKLAWLSVEAAHIRADEADKTRNVALEEMQRLKVTNLRLELTLQETIQQLYTVTDLRDADQVTIKDLKALIESNREQIEDNHSRIAELQEQLSKFEHSAFTLTPVDTGQIETQEQETTP